MVFIGLMPKGVWIVRSVKRAGHALEVIKRDLPRLLKYNPHQPCGLQFSATQTFICVLFDTFRFRDCNRLLTKHSAPQLVVHVPLPGCSFVQSCP